MQGKGVLCLQNIVILDNLSIYMVNYIYELSKNNF